MTAATIVSEVGWDISKWKNEDHFVRNNVFDRNSFEHLNVAVSVKRYRALFMDA